MSNIIADWNDQAVIFSNSSSSSGMLWIVGAIFHNWFFKRQGSLHQRSCSSSSSFADGPWWQETTLQITVANCTSVALQIAVANCTSAVATKAVVASASASSATTTHAAAV